MSSSGSLFSEGENFAPDRMDAKTWFWGTGDAIASIPNTNNAPAAVCTETGSGFNIDEAYYRTADRLGWLAFLRRHLHDSTDDVAGGLLSEIMIANAGKLFYWDKSPSKLTDFFTEVSTGTVTQVEESSNQTYINMNTTSSTSKYAMVKAGGFRISFANKIDMRCKTQVSHSTDIVFRNGINMEKVQSAGDNARKIGLEGCASAPVNPTKIQIASADGVNRSVTPTSQDIAQGAPKGYRLLFTSATDIVYSDTIGSGTTKTTNIPSTSFNAEDAMYRYGVFTTNTTAKTALLWAIRIVGTIGDVDWVG